MSRPSRPAPARPLRADRRHGQGEASRALTA